MASAILICPAGINSCPSARRTPVPARIATMFQCAFERADGKVFSLKSASGRATAFCIDSKNGPGFLTAAHAVTAGSEVQLEGLPGVRDPQPFRVGRVCPQHDLALLLGQSANLARLSGLGLSTTRAQPGMSACVVGWSATWSGEENPPYNLRILGGIVGSSLTLVPIGVNGAFTAFDFDVNVERGFSGSPVLDCSGCLVGMICKARQQFPPGSDPIATPVNFTMAVGVEAIAAFVGLPI